METVLIELRLVKNIDETTGTAQSLDLVNKNLSSSHEIM